jgi:hypothetical protein
VAGIPLAAAAAAPDLYREHDDHGRDLVDLPRRAHLRWVVRVQRWNPGVLGGPARFRVVRRRADRAVTVGLAERVGSRLLERACRVVLLLHPGTRRTGFSLGVDICSVSSAGWGRRACSFSASASYGAFPDPNQGRSVPKGADRLPVTGDVAVVAERPKTQDPCRSNVTCASEDASDSRCSASCL